ncbi:MAG: TIGR04283 family arsenosugar biosynthesis glycosyltransferase [Gammaproteobacteria bacterium]|nr:TIGR04283 family arsenosugar biosynthesis glycosyltransferase [Gammaproteobacteria bacterium]
MVAAAADHLHISIIIPVLNEAGAITATLESLQPLRRNGHEVVVVDGGSHDASVALAEALADQVVHSERGRASQLQAGASAACGSILWFLHADTLPPPHADRLIQDALHPESACWGRFDVQFPERHRLLRLVAWSMNTRSRLTGIATGDQGIFVTRDCFEQAGGFPSIPLMEDIALSRTLKRRSPPACLRQCLTTSARRWRKHGTVRTILLMWGLRLGYFLGISPRRLAGYYAAHRS